MLNRMESDQGVPEDLGLQYFDKAQTSFFIIDDCKIRMCKYVKVPPTNVDSTLKRTAMNRTQRRPHGRSVFIDGGGFKRVSMTIVREKRIVSHFLSEANKEITQRVPSYIHYYTCTGRIFYD